MISVTNLTTLTPTEAELLLKHCALSGRMRRLRNLRKFLVEEIHTKRATLKRKKYKVLPELDRPYGQILFMGKKVYTSFSAFPCSYQCVLDSLLLREFRHTNIETALLNAAAADGVERANLTAFYYCPEFPVRELQDAAKFDALEWSLNDPADDLAILTRFRDELLAFMLDVEALVKQTTAAFRQNNQTHRLRNERRRYARVCCV